MSQVHFAGSEFALTLQPRADKAHEDVSGPGLGTGGEYRQGLATGDEPRIRRLARFVTARILSAHFGAHEGNTRAMPDCAMTRCSLPRGGPFLASSRSGRVTGAPRAKGSPRGSYAPRGAIRPEAFSRAGLDRARGTQGVASRSAP